MTTATEPTTESGHTFRAERTKDEVVLRFPSPNRLMRAFLPEEAVKHMMAAQKEQLLALRSIVDAAINRLDQAQNEDAPRGPRRTEIRVE
jgi:hypothetical protein